MDLGDRSGAATAVDVVAANPGVKVWTGSGLGDVAQPKTTILVARLNKKTATEIGNGSMLLLLHSIGRIFIRDSLIFCGLLCLLLLCLPNGGIHQFRYRPEDASPSNNGDHDRDESDQASYFRARLPAIDKKTCE